MTDLDGRRARVALAHLVEPGNRELGMLLRHVGPADALLRLLRGGVSERLHEAARLRLTEAASPDRPDERGGSQPDGPRLASGGADTDRVSVAVALAEAALLRAARLGARIATPEDPDWPVGLDDLGRISRETANGTVDRDTEPPLCLWVRGHHTLDTAFERSVAIVGARAATSYGTHVASDLAYGLAEQGWTVVSGGAFGIDAAAHRAALAVEGLTAAVLACGVDRPYPLGHANLFDRLAAEGLLVSEWPLSAAPHRVRFLIRNRVIAALTRGTVVVEAAQRSGARQTLGRARLLGRAAMVVPGPVTSAMSVGCHEELRRPDTIAVTTAAQVIEEVGRIGDDLAPPVHAPDRPHDRLDPLAAQVLDAVLLRRPRTAEQVAAAAGVTAREARRTLPMLVSGGFVESDAEGRGYRLRPPVSS